MEHLQGKLGKTPIFNGKIDGFRLRSSKRNQSIDEMNHLMACNSLATGEMTKNVY